MTRDFKKSILEGIPLKLPKKKALKKSLSHAPKRKNILTVEEKKLAIKNALRYFPKHMHDVLANEFIDELNNYGRIYMSR